jgi:chromosome segregation ATPase
MSTRDTGGSGKRTDATRELIRAKALERGQERSAETRGRVLTAMAIIEQEMASNGGIYPQNGGAVSAAEVARRAGVHSTTFFSPKQRELGKEVRTWLEALKKRNAASVRAVKRSLAERIADWKELYEGLAQSHRDTELQLQQVEAELGQARDQLVAVSHERDALREQLAKDGGGSVVPLRTKRT